MYCHKCGAENIPGCTFCRNCGTKLKQYDQHGQVAKENPIEMPDGELYNEQHIEASTAYTQPNLEQSLHPALSNESSKELQSAPEELQYAPEENNTKSGANAIIIAVVALVVLIGGYLLFANKKSMWPFSDSVELTEAKDEPDTESFIEQQIREGIFNAIPDHYFDKGASAGYLTDELFKLLEEAYDIPLPPSSGIGDDDFLYYFVSGNDDTTVSIESVKIYLKDNDNANAIIDTNGGRHTLNLVKKQNQWLLEDFDNQKQEISNYVKVQRDYISSGKYIIENDGSSEWNEYITAVREYMKKYGVVDNAAGRDKLIPNNTSSCQITYEGTIDKYPIVMCLTMSDDRGQVDGWYYYKSKGASNKIELRGKVEYEEGARYASLKLDEYVGDNITGSFIGSYGFDNSPSNRGNIYTGTWTSPSGKRLEFDLSDGNGFK